jgi:hypothetical protein
MFSFKTTLLRQLKMWSIMPNSHNRKTPEKVHNASVLALLGWYLSPVRPGIRTHRFGMVRRRGRKYTTKRDKRV